MLLEILFLFILILISIYLIIYLVYNKNPLVVIGILKSTEPSDTVITKKPPIDTVTKKPPDEVYTKCFYNTAYEDNDKMDKVQDIIKGDISNCYVLVEPDNVSKDDINKLQQNGNKIGCYLSVGSLESYRKDFDKFVKNVDYLNDKLPKWEKEFLLKGDKDGKPTLNTINLLKKRIDDMAAKNCDYVEMDNMDFTGDEKYQKQMMLTLPGIKAYNKELCNYIKTNPIRKMKCMYKNTGPSDDDSSFWDALTLESNKDNIIQWEPKLVNKFINENKPVYISHYGQPNEAGCENVFKKLKDNYKNTFGLVCSVYDGKRNNYLHYS
jgi:cysteinyl-tRNA synthetase